MLTAAIALTALGLVRAEDWGWTSVEVIGTLGASLALLGWFLLRSSRHPSPIVPLHLLRGPVFGPATLANLLFSVAFAAMLLSVVLWAQNAWGYSALRTGLAVAPGPLMVPALAIGAAPLARRIGAGAVATLGAVFFVAGNLWWVFQIDATPGYAMEMLPGMLLTGIGVGLTLPTLVSVAVTAVPPQAFATGSAVVTMVRQIGSVLGVAALVAVLGASPGGAGFDHAWLFIAAATAATGAVALTLKR